MEEIVYIININDLNKKAKQKLILTAKKILLVQIANIIKNLYSVNLIIENKNGNLNYRKTFNKIVSFLEKQIEKNKKDIYLTNDIVIKKSKNVKKQLNDIINKYYRLVLSNLYYKFIPF